MFSNVRLGIMCGGQLGKMLIQEASKWGIVTHVLDGDEDCPAAPIASHFHKGNHLDFETVYKFGKGVDLLTLEIENVNIDALKRLEAEGVTVLPSPSALEVIQDKGLQKEFYRSNGIPTSPFGLFSNREAILSAIDSGYIAYPFVQKLRKGGFDGRGVAVIRGPQEHGKLLDGNSVVEQMVTISKEIAVIGARNASGETRCFPAVEMVFNQQANLVERLVCPASIPSSIAIEAESITQKLMERLKMVGLLAVELFIDEQGNLLVNEAAPRPHNSGHHTIESMVTSQFEQHLRAILNLPLGSTSLKMPSVMLNLLGAQGHEGRVAYDGVAESLAIEGVKIHLYGKKITRPFRKMGHVTIVDTHIDSAIEKSEQVKHLLKVKT